jgi:hypothetical protein
MHTNYQKYREHANCKNLGLHPNLFGKHFAKEDARDISMIVPTFLLNFTLQHMWLIQMGIAIMENKNLCIYMHTSKLMDNKSFPVNQLVNPDTEPHINFRQVPLEYLDLI